MKKFRVKYIYSNGQNRHLGIAICFTEDTSEIEEKLSKKIKELYPSGSFIKLSNTIEELKDDIVVIK